MLIMLIMLIILIRAGVTATVVEIIHMCMYGVRTVVTILVVE